AHDRGVAGEKLLEQPPFCTPRRALGQPLGRGIPEDDAQLGVDRDDGIRQPGEHGFEVHCNDDAACASNRRWPVLDRRWLRSPFIPWLRSAVIPWLRSPFIPWLRSAVIPWLRSPFIPWLRSAIIARVPDLAPR